MKFFNYIISKSGLDKVIILTISGRLLNAGGSIITLSFIALFLNLDEQGFYYTFSSIIAIQIFFELGLNTIISQFAAHENAHLNSFNKSKNTKEKKHQSRLSSLLHLSIKWFSIISIFLFFTIFLIGYFFFTKFGGTNNVDWIIPWFILSINTSLSFIIQPILSFLEGVGRIKDVTKLRLYRQIVNLVLLWILLYSGASLYSAPIAGVVSFIYVIIHFTFSDFNNILIQIWKLLDKWKINYKSEIFPYQWKIAVSWMSGYFIFQLFNPVLFAIEGAQVAGQMGMTIAVFNGLSGLTYSWITTKVPKFSDLFAKKKFKQADQIFNTSFIQLLIINFSGFILIMMIINGLSYYEIDFVNRFLPLKLVFLIGISSFLNQFVFSWATYLRCHKKEPYLVTSVIGSFLVALSTIIFGFYFGVYGIVFGYFIIVSLMKIWEYRIFKLYRKKWNNPAFL